MNILLIKTFNVEKINPNSNAAENASCYQISNKTAIIDEVKEK